MSSPTLAKVSLVNGIAARYALVGIMLTHNRGFLPLVSTNKGWMTSAKLGSTAKKLPAATCLAMVCSTNSAAWNAEAEFGQVNLGGFDANGCGSP